jgi:hypothetical protein
MPYYLLPLELNERNHEREITETLSTRKSRESPIETKNHFIL